MKDDCERPYRNGSGAPCSLACSVHPLLELLGGLDCDKSPHPVMAQTAELCAGNLVLELGIPRPGPHLRGRDVGDEPEGDREAGDGVLLHAKLGHAEAVDDVLAPEPHDDRPVHRQIELIERRDVVLCGRIGAIESQGVRLGVEQLDVRAAEFPVGAGIVDVPGELLGR